MMRYHPRPGIDVGEPRAMLEECQPVTVLDIRSAADRAEWTIPGSIYLDAYDALNAGERRPPSGPAACIARCRR